VRIRTLFIAIALAVLAVGVTAAPAMADTSITQLKQQLRRAKQSRERARERARVAAADLAGARELYAATNVAGDTVVPDPATMPIVPPASMTQTVAAALLADGVVTADEVAAQQARSARTRKLARRWTIKVRRLQRRIRRLQQIAEWNRRGQWKPLIEIAARRHGVSAAGLHRMMLLESGGRRAVGGMYKGLFQYYPGTWAGSWNPWRHESIYNGWAQIRATAYAVSRGMGASQWPHTYPMAF
jgi:hypothetical protein